ncbi:MAG: hypothetical protein Q9N62_08190 [Ghiorsea sp.]|nr:hypothetical protein [Ghiorsea sp.]
MPDKWTYRIIAGLTLAVILYVLFPNSEPDRRPNLWSIKHIDNTLSILDLTINHHSLQDALTALRVTPEIALFTTRQKQGDPEPDMHLEAFLADLYDEGDSIILGLDADSELLQHIKKQAYQPQLFPNNVIRIGVQESLIPDILNLTIHNITIITGTSIMFEDFKEKFGEPEKLINDGVGNAHFLYPTMGLDFIQPANGAQVLQFVDPARFNEDLLKPLIKSLPKGAM